MASAAEIGVSNSRYTGNGGIGGGTFGSFQLDTKPIEDLARYTMLYNRAEYEQRQKDAEKAALEIADMTSYDLTSGIPKDAKLLQEKYDKLTAYVRDNPNALDYRNKKEWAEYKKMRNDLDNDLEGAKVRNTMWKVRQKEIQDQTDPKLRKIMQKELDDEISATEIRTPIKHSRAFEDYSIKLPDAPELTFDVVKTGPNATIIRDQKMFNLPRAKANGGVFALGLDSQLDPNTPEGQRQTLARKNNFFLQGADAMNSVINAKDPATGAFLYKKELVDAAGNKTYVLDESNLGKLPQSLLNLVKETNAYITETKRDIENGVYLDQFENPITFGEGALDKNDYAEINYQDGISPEELALVAQYAKWKGDTYSTKVQQTDNALQASAQEVQKRGQDISAATARRGQDLENGRFWAGFNKGKTEDLLSADAVLKEVADAVNSGIKTDVVTYGSNGSRKVAAQVLKIADPSLLKEFGTIDKDGKTTNVPDFVYLDPKTNKMSLVYQKRTKNTEGVATNNIEMKNGEPVIDNRIELLPTQWMTNITKRKFPNKDIGGINTLINQVYDAYGRNVTQLVEGYQGGTTIPTNQKTTESGRVGGSGKFDAEAFYNQNKK